MARLWLALLIIVLGSRCGSCLLSNDFTVASYRLNLTVVDSASPASGSVDIDLVFLNPTSTISLDWGSSLDPPQKENFTIVRQSGSSPPVAVAVGHVAQNRSQTAATIATNPTTPEAPSFAKDDKVTLTVRFRTAVNREQKGLFSYQYTSDGGKGTVIATSLYPSYARDLFPCVDEPSRAATIKLTLTTPASWDVATSLQLYVSTINETTKMSTKTYVSSSSLPTYALAIFISDDMKAVDYINSVRTNITFWVPKDSSSANFKDSLNFLQDYLYKVEDTFNLHSCLTTTLNIVLVPELPSPFAGHSIIFIRNTIYSISFPSPQSEGVFRETVVPVVYQFLRQFTEFSTRPASWADSWLSTAMTSYLHYVFLNSLETPFDFRTDLEVVARQTALALDGTYSKPLEDRSIDGASPSVVEASVMDPLKRLKGASMFSMLDLSFRAGAVYSTFRSLLLNHIGASVDSADFYKQFSASSTNGAYYVSYNTKRALDNLPSWLNSSGYPLINVTYGAISSSKMSLSLKMEPFCQLSSCRDYLLPTWTVPVTVGTTAYPNYFTPRQDIWVNTTSTTTMGLSNIEEGDWVVVNMQSGGYYRAQYWSSNWETLGAANISSRPLGCSHLLDDAFALSAAGLLDYNVTLHLAVTNMRDRPYRDWYPVAKGLARLRDSLWGTDLYPTFQNFFAPLLQNINAFVEHNINGWFSNLYDREKVFSLFLEEMCNYDIGNIRSTALTHLPNTLQGFPPSTVASSSYNSLVCCGAQYSSSLSAQTLWEAVKDSSASYYKRHFNAIALGCLSNSNQPIGQLKTFLVNNTEVEHRNAYIVTMLSFLAEKQPLTFLSLIADFPENFQNQLGASVLPSLVSVAGRKINSNSQADIVRRIALARVDAAVKDSAIATLDAITTRISWLTSHNTSLVSGLHANRPNVTNSTSGTPLPKSLSPPLLLGPCFIALATFSR